MTNPMTLPEQLQAAEAGSRELAAFLQKEADQIVHDLAHHTGDQVFDVLKRNGLLCKSEAGTTAMLTLTAINILLQAIDQCSRAAEEDCSKAVLALFCNCLPDEHAAAIKARGDG